MEIKSLPDMQARLEEIEMLSKVIESILGSEPTLNIPTKDIKSYFVPFSLRLMAS